MIRIALFVSACLLVASPVQARHRHHVQFYAVSPECNITMPCEGVTASPRGERVVRAMGGLGVAKKVYTPRVSNAKSQDYISGPLRRAGKPNVIRAVADVAKNAITHLATIVPHPEGCPRSAFCGCGAAVRIFGAPIRSLWLAANWFKFPRATPAPGMVAVRSHHVFVLEADLGGGLWRVWDANSGGHQTRVRARSLAGYTVVNPHGGAG